MKYADLMKNIYWTRLGQHLEMEFIKQNIAKTDVAYDGPKDIEYISDRTVDGIFKADRNMTLKAARAIKETVGYSNYLELFFPNSKFRLIIITDILNLIISNDLFSNKLLRNSLSKHLDCSNSTTEEAINIFVKKYQDELLNSITNFFTDCSIEKTSKDVSEQLVDWMSELACFIASL